MAEFTIIDLGGNNITLGEWQHKYKLPLGSNQIGTYFSIAQYKTVKNPEHEIDSDKPEFWEVLVSGDAMIKDGGCIAEDVIKVLDTFRYLKGGPVKINSLDRSPEKQKELINLGVRAATFSPHVVCMAADIDTVSESDTLKSVGLLKKAAQIVGCRIRIGYKQYLKDGNTFIHFDVCPEYYAEGEVFHDKPHPLAWEAEVIW